MYTSGWGFHAQIDRLHLISEIWTSRLRPYRLARARAQQELQSGQVRLNLASLPLEVHKIIEHNILEDELLSRSMLPIYKPACHCSFDLMNSLLWPSMQKSLRRHLNPNHTPDEIDAMLTPEIFRNILKDGFDHHIAHSECPGREAFEKHWRALYQCLLGSTGTARVSDPQEQMQVRYWLPNDYMSAAIG